MRIIGIIVAVMFVVSFPLAHADRFSEWMTVWKKQEEKKAIEYQKNILHFDYAKINNKDKGFKGPVETKVMDKKHIQNEKRITFKIIKQKS